MKTTYTFRNVESSDGIKNYGDEKLEKLAKFVRGDLVADVTLTKERHLQQVEVKVLGDGQEYVAHHESEDMYASIDLCVDKLQRPLREHKAIVTDHKKG